MENKVEYRSIEGYPGYRVGSDGSVWTKKASGPRRHSSESDGEWRKMRPRPRGGNGSLSVDLCRDNKAKHFSVHKLVLEAFVGPCPKGLVSCHGPGGKHDNSVENLRWGTQKSNIADKARDGTRVFGVRHHYAKLTPEIVSAARTAYFSGSDTILGLSKTHGVSFATMHAAIHRQTWKDVA